VTTPTLSTMSIPEAAIEYGVSEEHARRLARAGKLPGSFRLGRTWRVSVEGMRRYLASRDQSTGERAS